MDPPSSNPFQCKKCDKEFTKASLLKRHAEKANECKKKPKKALCYFCRYNLLLVVPPKTFLHLVVPTNVCDPKLKSVVMTTPTVSFAEFLNCWNILCELQGNSHKMFQLQGPSKAISFKSGGLK